MMICYNRKLESLTSQGMKLLLTRQSDLDVNTLRNPAAVERHHANVPRLDFTDVGPLLYQPQCEADQLWDITG